MDKPKRLLKVKEVMSRVGLSRSQLYKMIGFEDFPTPVNVTPRRVVWIESEVEEWIEKRIRVARDDGL